MFNCSKLIGFWNNEYLFDLKKKNIIPNHFDSMAFHANLNKGEFIEKGN